MKYPDAVLIYKQSLAKSRMNLVQMLGIDIPELYYALIRKGKGDDPGTLCIRVGQPRQKRGSKEERTELSLSNDRLGEIHPELGEKATSVSNLYEPDPEKPGYGYGDINGTDSAFLSIRSPEEGTLKIMVFLGLKDQKKVLFQLWKDGKIGETLKDCKVDFSVYLPKN